MGRAGRSGQLDPEHRELTWEELAELFLHEWGLTWREIEEQWTDEMLACYADGLVARLRREQERRLAELRVLVAASGAELRPGPETPTDDWVRQAGGAVEEV